MRALIAFTASTIRFGCSYREIEKERQERVGDRQTGARERETREREREREREKERKREKERERER